jgi:hypothetical protein
VPGAAPATTVAAAASKATHGPACTVTATGASATGTASSSLPARTVAPPRRATVPAAAFPTTRTRTVDVTDAPGAIGPTAHETTEADAVQPAGRSPATTPAGSTCWTTAEAIVRFPVLRTVVPVSNALPATTVAGAVRTPVAARRAASEASATAEGGDVSGVEDDAVSDSRTGAPSGPDGSVSRTPRSLVVPGARSPSGQRRAPASTAQGASAPAAVAPAGRVPATTTSPARTPPALVTWIR